MLFRSSESVMPSSHLILHRPLFLLSSIFPSIRVFSSESVLRLRLLFSCSVLSNSVQSHGLQHARLPCPSPSPRACSNSCPLSQSCHATISSSVIPFSCFFNFPGGSDGSVCLQCGRPGFDCWAGKIFWRKKWQPTPVLLPGKSHGWRSVVGYSPWVRRVGHD